MHKKWSFPLWISSVNVTKSAGNCEFGHLEKSLMENFTFCAVILIISSTRILQRRSFGLIQIQAFKAPKVKSGSFWDTYKWNLNKCRLAPKFIVNLFLKITNDSKIPCTWNPTYPGVLCVLLLLCEVAP